MLLCFGGTCKSPAEIVNSLIIRAVSSRQRWKAPMSAFLLLSDNMSSGKFCPHSEIRSILFFLSPSPECYRASSTVPSTLGQTQLRLYAHSNPPFSLQQQFLCLPNRPSLFSPSVQEYLVYTARGLRGPTANHCAGSYNRLLLMMHRARNSLPAVYY